MHIDIAERLHPFSSKPGTPFLIPLSQFRLRAFPAAVFIDDLSRSQPFLAAKIEWEVAGPVDDFTVIQDLEKGCVKVFVRGRQGYFRYVVAAADGGGATITSERAPAEGVAYRFEGSWKAPKSGTLREGDAVTIAPHLTPSKQIPRSVQQPIERLSLGNHKKQDWDLVSRREDFSEIFPLWHRLGQLAPKTGADSATGTALLLEACRQTIGSGSPETILKAFRALYLAGFEGGLSPRLQDSDHHGIKVGGEPLFFDDRVEISPLVLISEGAELIRSLFLQEENGQVRLLPALPPEFSCGRLVNAKCGLEGQVSVEWTKKRLRQVAFIASENQAIAFVFCRGEKRCRLSRSTHDRGVEYLSGQLIKVNAGEYCWLDRFEN